MGRRLEGLFGLVWLAFLCEGCKGGDDTVLNAHITCGEGSILVQEEKAEVAPGDIVEEVFDEDGLYLVRKCVEINVSSDDDVVVTEATTTYTETDTDIEDNDTTQVDSSVSGGS